MSKGRKKIPPVHSHGINEIYLDTTQPFNQQLERAWRILDEGKLDHVVIHGIGPAMSRVLNLALQIKNRGKGMYDLSTTTHTVTLHDELEDDTIQSRKNSSVSVKVFRTLGVTSSWNPS
eukprot:sb/3476262/